MRTLKLGENPIPSGIHARIHVNVVHRLLRFGRYYEDRLYEQKWERLAACLPVIHQIRHLADTMRWDGVTRAMPSG